MNLFHTDVSVSLKFIFFICIHLTNTFSSLIKIRRVNDTWKILWKYIHTYMICVYINPNFIIQKYVSIYIHTAINTQIMMCFSLSFFFPTHHRITSSLCRNWRQHPLQNTDTLWIQRSCTGSRASLSTSRTHEEIVPWRASS